MKKCKYILLIIVLTFSFFGWTQNNLLDTSSWSVGTGSVNGFSTYGPTAENERINAIGPHGNTNVLWMSKPSGDGGADGGIYTWSQTIDPTQTYRFTIWLKKTGSTSGSSYFGLYTRNASDQETTMRFDGTINTNPYFWWGDLPELDKWYLLVGYIHPNSYSGPHLGEVYDMATGSVVASINATDYKFAPGAATLMLRSVLFADTNASDRQYYWGPTIYLVNGQEPAIAELLNPGGSSNINVTSVSLNTSSLSLNVSDTQSLLATVSPSDATDQSVAWSTSNSSVATVDSNGLVTANTEGTATIMVTTNDGGFTAQATATVAASGGSSGGSGNSVWSENGTVASYTGEIAVGTSSVPSGYKMAVDGNVIAEEMKVQLSGDWPDYVFKEDYELPTLKEIQKHIKEKGHLPNIPSGKEVETYGIALGEMNRLLLEKIEELTLYLLHQEEKLQKQQKELEVLKLKVRQ